MKKIYFECISSTNTKIKKLLAADFLDEFTIVEAGFQTAGRGQKGNFWESKPKQNLIFSVLLKPTFVAVDMQFILSQITSLAIKYTLDKYVKDISIKWPNDIYYQDSKICGMLIENILDENGIQYTILGIGLNINQTIFESNAPNPVSLAQIIGKPLEKDVLLESFIQQLRQLYHSIHSNSYWVIVKNEYLSALYRRDGYFMYEDEQGRFSAYIESIDEQGYIYLRRKDNGVINKYAFKEVKHVIGRS